MDIPRWKIILSYLIDFRIECSSSEHHSHLDIWLSKGRFQLCTANAVYSYEDLYDNFGRLFNQKLNMGRLPGKQVLILGLGLGSIPIILDRLSYGEWDISAVEVDEEVCRLANVYATPKISSPMEVHVADAQSFLALNQTSFDLICVDLFVDDQIPEKFKTQDFLEELKGSLAPKGLLVFNTLAFRDSDKKESRDFFDGIFNTVFENGELVPVYKNYMLINDRTYLL